MIISITNVAEATFVFITLLAIVFFVSIYKRKDTGLSPAASTELKGFAILAIIFSHVGYFLVSDTHFLYPLTIFAGVGVDIFLLLSGYGIAVSQIKKDYKPWEFYKQRLLKLLVPFWLVLIVFFFLNSLFSNAIYSWSYILRDFLGFFPRADLYQDVNSPLWYFTFILFCYLVFPLLFSKKRPALSALGIFVALCGLWYLSYNFFPSVSGLYSVHVVAFPLGVLLAGILQNEAVALKMQTSKFFNKLSDPKSVWNYVAQIILLSIFCYTIYRSGVGKGVFLEQGISLISVAAIVGFFSVKRFGVKLFYLVGVYSYELYLLHWPIMYRYDFLFKFLPAWAAMALYLIVFIGLGWVLQKVAGFIGDRINPKPAIK
ncbi:MAG: acyltransferase [Candidatus Falkowbacteria bacterium]